MEFQKNSSMGVNSNKLIKMKILKYIFFIVILLIIINLISYIVVIKTQEKGKTIVVKSADLSNKNIIKRDNVEKTSEQNSVLIKEPAKEIEKETNTNPEQNNKTEEEKDNLPEYNETHKENTSQQNKNKQDNQTSNQDSDNETIQKENKTGIACLDKYNMSINTIIFYYSTDKYSKNMKEIADEIKEDYNFYYQNNLWDSDFNSCFGLTGEIPVFICAKNKDTIKGEVSKSELINFIDSCI